VPDNWTSGFEGLDIDHRARFRVRVLTRGRKLLVFNGERVRRLVATSGEAHYGAQTNGCVQASTLLDQR
jgi:hypothetical protein